MLTHPTVDKLHELRCTGMAKALAEQLASPEVDALSFEERFGLLVDRELTERYSRQLTNRLRRARLKHDACIEDIDFRHRRGLDKDLVLSLADGRWVREHLNVLITGPTGVGKTWVACALAHSACRHGHSATYLRLPRLLTELAIARADGRYPKLLASLAKTEVLVIDDWGLAKLSAENRRDLLEIIEDRHGVRSTIATSQFPVEKWHDVIAKGEVHLAGARATGLCAADEHADTVAAGAVRRNTIWIYYGTTSSTPTNYQSVTCQNRRNPGQVPANHSSQCRVKGWRAYIRVRWRVRRFRAGPQSGSHRHVSSPCSPNPACRFPAPGSPVGSCASYTDRRATRACRWSESPTSSAAAARRPLCIPSRVRRAVEPVHASTTSSLYGSTPSLMHVMLPESLR